MSLGTGMTGAHLPVALTNTWLTPPALLRALGAFDLDPCAAPEPRPWATAERMISLPQDGLAIEWAGRVWCNPPYGRQTGQWLSRLAAHGDGIALIFARTETEMFFRHVWAKAHALLFLRGRLTLYRPDGSPAAANGGAPSVLVAYGLNNADALKLCGIPGSLVDLRTAKEAA